jgi:hypothetical protein
MALKFRPIRLQTLWGPLKESREHKTRERESTLKLPHKKPWPIRLAATPWNDPPRATRSCGYTCHLSNLSASPTSQSWLKPYSPGSAIAKSTDEVTTKLTTPEFGQ